MYHSFFIVHHIFFTHDGELQGQVWRNLGIESIGQTVQLRETVLQSFSQVHISIEHNK